MSQKKQNSGSTPRQTTPRTQPNAAPQTLYTASSPEQRLPYINLMTAFTNSKAPNQPISFQQLGEFVADQYTFAPQSFLKLFVDYQDQHAMGPLREQLKSGMDEISCAYIDLHEATLDIARHGVNCLTRQNYLWTDYDRKLFAHNRQIMRNPPNSWLASINLEGNSMVTNCYGLTDFPKEVLAKINGKAIIDGGAFIGDTIPVFRNVFPQSVAYCFEPSANNFEEMQRIFKHEIENNFVKPVQMGLGHQPQTMTLSKVQGAVDSMASVARDYNNPELTEQISITTVDDFVKEHQLEVGLFKLDVEGFEPQALQGAINTIKEQKPMLVIAIYHTPEEFYELKSYLQSLDLGYKFAIRRSSFTNSHTELVLIAYQETESTQANTL